MPHPRASRTAAAATALAAAAALALHPLPAAADSAGRPLSELLRDLHVMYEKTESASDAYNRTAGRLSRQRKRTEKAEKALASLRSTLAEERRKAGEIARRQYRRGDVGLPPVVQLLLTREPRDAMGGLHVLTRSAGHQALTVQRLAAGERLQRRVTAKARKHLARQQRLADRKQKQRDTVRSRLRRIERTLATLTEAELSRLRTMESAQQTSAQRTLMSAHGLDSADARRKPSQAGEQAVRFARSQVGRPCRSGANGPAAYDSSGLTSKAWEKAGRSIPRTGRGQWERLRRVPMDELRPGDIVVYYRSAAHVAIYAGEGEVVHAPRPGDRVRLAPLAAVDSVRGAVRPDAGGPPAKSSRLPDVRR